MKCLVLSVLFLGGCVMPIAPGPKSELTSTSARQQNNPPQTLGEATDAAGNKTTQLGGAASVSRVKQTGTSIDTEKSGGEQTSIILERGDTKLSFLTPKDYKLESVRFNPQDGTLDLKKFEASGSEATKAIAVPMGAWVEYYKTLTPAQQQAFKDYLDAQVKAAEAIGSPFAGVLAKLAGAVAGV